MYAHRQHIPLLNGNEMRNFAPRGSGGIPISGVALLAIHAMPLGCMKCGHLLAVHQLMLAKENEHDMTLALARRALQENRKAIFNMRQDQSIEMPNWGSYKRTRYIEAILEVQSQVQRRRADARNLTGYFFTNYGPKPSIEVLQLDNAILDFIDVAQQDYSHAWQRASYRAWKPPKEEQGAIANETNIRTWQNLLYESLFDLPRENLRFLHLLKAGEDWELIALFLRKVMLMEKERIEAYRSLGDRLAGYIVEYEGNARGFYYQFSRAENYTNLRRIIKSAAEKMMKAQTNEPLFTYDEFILAFEHPSEGYNQWKLARDLISFRILEQMHRRGIDMSDIPEESLEENDNTEEN